jgi:hypothetical protein
VSSGGRSFIGGGASNLVSGAHAVVVGGQFVTASGAFSVAGGCRANASGCSSVAIGGSTASGYRTVALGGGGGAGVNAALGSYSAVAGGSNNSTCSGYSFIGGGYSNATCGQFSAAFGCGVIAASACYLYANNICNVSGGTSDCRMKHSICPLTYNLDKLTQLDPVSFIFNGDCANHRRYGFIAQQVCQILPEIITHHLIDKIDAEGNVGGEIEGDPILQFEKDALYASYVNALKELKERVEALETEVQALKTK